MQILRKGSDFIRAFFSAVSKWRKDVESLTEWNTLYTFCIETGTAETNKSPITKSYPLLPL